MGRNEGQFSKMDLYTLALHQSIPGYNPIAVIFFFSEKF